MLTLQLHLQLQPQLRVLVALLVEDVAFTSNAMDHATDSSTALTFEGVSFLNGQSVQSLH